MIEKSAGLMKWIAMELRQLELLEAIQDDEDVKGTFRTMTMVRSGILACIAIALCGLLSMHAETVLSSRSVIPMDRLNESWWAERHAAVLAAVHAHPETPLLLIGDSITNNYDKSKLPDENFVPTWQAFYAPRHALNLGFSGDSTEHVLWRLSHGEVDGLHPKVVMLLIGTNNTGHEHQSAAETEIGIDAVVGALESRLPDAQILLLAVLPSDISAEKSASDCEVNQYLRNNYGVNSRVSFLDIGSIFYRDGTLNTDIFYDPRLPQHGAALHPDTNGQRRMAEAIEPTLSHLMGDEPRVSLASMTDINTGLIPVPRLEQDSYDWLARHEAELRLQRTMKPDVVLIGDSITHFWEGLPYAARRSGIVSWQHTFGALQVINMGFGWDRTQNVLWRLDHGEFDGIAPQWVVLNIGTNNLTATQNARANTPEEIAAGIAAICNVIERRSPSSHILLMAIFPRGANPGGALRGPIATVNHILTARFAGNLAVTVIDVGSRFLAADGTLPSSLMPDGTHPSDKGYAIWGDALVKAGIHR